jgi:hypothetical protein
MKKIEEHVTCWSDLVVPVMLGLALGLMLYYTASNLAMAIGFIFG